MEKRIRNFSTVKGNECFFTSISAEDILSIMLSSCDVPGPIIIVPPVNK